jgi:hypothetical protein
MPNQTKLFDSPKTAAAPSRWHEREAPKDGSSADEPRSRQGRTWLRSKTLANDEAKHDAEKSPEEVVAEQDRVSEVKVEMKIEAGTSSWWPPNRTVRFPKPGHPISLGSGQKKTLRTTTPGTTPAPRRCPPGLTPSQRRRI